MTTDGDVVAEWLIESKDWLVEFLDGDRESDAVDWVCRELGWSRFKARLLVWVLRNLSAAAADQIKGCLTRALLSFVRNVPGLPHGMAKLVQHLRAQKSKADQTRAQQSAHLDGDFLLALPSGTSIELATAIAALTEIRTLSESNSTFNNDIWALLQKIFDEVTSNASGPQPALMLGAHQGSALSFLNTTRPFGGRVAELDHLEAFCRSHAPAFAWCILEGASGSGKSRSALELCLRLAPEFRAGIYRALSTPFDWHGWKPNRPTLLVFDNADENHREVLEAITALADRAFDDGLGDRRPEHAIRAIVCDRSWPSGESSWKDVFTRCTSGYVAASHAGPSDTCLAAIDDEAAWMIAQDERRRSGISHELERYSFLSRLSDVDSAKSINGVILVALGMNDRVGVEAGLLELYSWASRSEIQRIWQGKIDGGNQSWRSRYRLLLLLQLLGPISIEDYRQLSSMGQAVQVLPPLREDGILEMSDSVVLTSAVGTDGQLPHSGEMFSFELPDFMAACLLFDVELDQAPRQRQIELLLGLIGEYGQNASSGRFGVAMPDRIMRFLEHFPISECSLATLASLVNSGAAVPRAEDKLLPWRRFLGKLEHRLEFAEQKELDSVVYTFVSTRVWTRKSPWSLACFRILAPALRSGRWDA